MDLWFGFLWGVAITILVFYILKVIKLEIDDYLEKKIKEFKK